MCGGPGWEGDKNPGIKRTAQGGRLDRVGGGRRGRPVRDLEAKDVEVTDNGVVQKITRFRLVEGEEKLAKDAAGSTSGSAASAFPRTAIALAIAPSRTKFIRAMSIHLIT